MESSKLKSRSGFRKGIARSRIDYDLYDNSLCLHMAGSGLSVKFMSEQTGLSRGQIYYRLKQQGCKLRSVRDGETQFGQTIVAEFKVSKA